MKTKVFNIYNRENQTVQDAYAMLAASIHLKSSTKNIKSVVITSCKPGVGKTSMAISLSVTMTKSGWKVLLIDADMRKPTKAKRLNKDSTLGLTDYLAGDIELEEAVYNTNIHNLTYISCGEKHKNPIGLLCSARFDEMMDKLKREYDFIIFDTPALTSVADASLMAAKSDTTLLVVEMGVSNLLMLKRAKEQLEKVNAHILGVVLNKVKKRVYVSYYESYNYFFNPKKFLNKRGSKKNTFGA